MIYNLELYSIQSQHFGGVWETAVKAIDHHLRRIIGKVSSTLEEFNTVRTQIEACLNSRPNSLLLLHTDDLISFKPGQFLVESPLVTMVEPNSTMLKTDQINRC